MSRGKVGRYWDVPSLDSGSELFRLYRSSSSHVFVPVPGDGFASVRRP